MQSFCNVCKAVVVLLLGDVPLQQVATKGVTDPNWKNSVFLKARKVCP